MSPRILIVDDEPALAHGLSYALTREHFDVSVCDNGVRAVNAALTEHFDLIILDLMLPGLSGIEACRRIRKRSGVPIIMLTARDSEHDLVTGLQTGADDYVTKPFSSLELLSRIRALLRRRAIDQTTDHPLIRTVGDITINPLNHQVTRNGTAIPLTPSEYKILALLAGDPGAVHTRRQIMEHLWESININDEHACEVHISSLRRKIEHNPNHPELLLTVRNVGYRLDPTSATSSSA
jgi:DNA-binding response OmpR family regulator